MHGECETKYRKSNFCSYARAGDKTSLYDAQLHNGISYMNCSIKGTGRRMSIIRLLGWYEDWRHKFKDDLYMAPIVIGWLMITQNTDFYRVTQKKGTFEKPNKNWRSAKKKKILLTNIEPLQLAFQETIVHIISVWKLHPVDGVLLYVCILSICRWGSPLPAAISQLGYHEFRLGFFVSVHPVSFAESCRPDS